MPSVKSTEPLLRIPVVIDAEHEQHALALARAAIRSEIAGLEALSQSLDGTLALLAERIIGLSGRVILSGVGKSAHVARKIAATLASTGTPAQFVHAADASHGDMGMITRSDLVLMLSKSGGTAELDDLANYCVRFDIPLALITQNPASRLGKAAGIVIELPAAEEACDITYAPTTSTTMMMALGDALAVVLMRRRGLKASEFRVFHPGGTLGSALLSVGDIMHKGDKLPVVAPDASVSDAIIEMSTKGFGCTGIVGPDGVLLGIITDGDLRRHVADGMLARRATEIMTRSPRTIPAEALLSEALRRMTDETPKVTAIFAMDGARPVGIVHLHDCLRVGLA